MKMIMKMSVMEMIMKMIMKIKCIGSENVDMSSDKVGENLICCKFKVFWVRFVFLGLVGF